MSHLYLRRVQMPYLAPIGTKRITVRTEICSEKVVLFKLKYLADKLPKDKTDDISWLPVAGVEKVRERIFSKVPQS